MKALILAAGRGRRMKGLTEDRPKALLTVRGKPLLKSAIENLREAGIANIGIVLGYKAESMRWPEFEASFVNTEWETTNMVYSLFRADEYLSKGPTIICYSDILFTPATITKLSEARGDIVISNNVNWLNGWKKRFADPLVDAETFKLDSQKRLIEIGQKPTSLSDIHGQYMGLIKITPEGWRKFKSLRAKWTEEQFQKVDMTSTLNLLLQAGIEIGTVDVLEEWHEFDSEEDIQVFE